MRRAGLRFTMLHGEVVVGRGGVGAEEGAGLVSVGVLPEVRRRTLTVR